MYLHGLWGFDLLLVFSTRKLPVHRASELSHELPHWMGPDARRKQNEKEFVRRPTLVDSRLPPLDPRRLDQLLIFTGCKVYRCALAR